MFKGLYRKKVLLSVLAFLFIGLVLGKDLIAARAVNIYLSKVFQEKGWTAELIQVEKEHILLQGVSGPGVTIDRANVFCHLQMLPFSFQPEISISGITLTQKEEEEKNTDLNFISLIMGDRFLEPIFHIEEGVWNDGSSSFSFRFLPGQESHKLGTLYVHQKEEEKPFLCAELAKEKKQINATLEISQGNLEFFFPWFPELGLGQWEAVEGQINAYIQCSLHQEKGLSSLQANISLEKIDLKNSSLDQLLQAASLQGTLSYSAKDNLPIWKQADLFLTFEDLSWSNSEPTAEFGVNKALGEIRLQPGQDPYIKAGGAWLSKGSLMPFELEGSGEILDKGAYWVQTNLTFFLSHSQPQLALSFWQNEEDEGILEVRWDKIGKEISQLYDQIRPVFNGPEYALQKGELTGRFLASRKNGDWRSLEIFDCIGKNLAFCCSEGSFQVQDLFLQAAIKEKQIVSLQTEVRKATFSLQEGQLEEINAKIEVADGLFMPSYLEGSYQGAKIAMQVLASSAEALLHIECGLPIEEVAAVLSLEEKIQSQKDPIFVVLDLQELETQTGFTGTARFPALDCIQDLEIQGTVQKKISRKVSDLFSSWDLSSLKGSFSMKQFWIQTLSAYYPDLFAGANVQGSCDLNGTFNAREIQLDLSSVELNLEQSPYSIACSVGSKEPARFTYSMEKKYIEGEAFLDRVWIEDSSLQLSIEIEDTCFNVKDKRIWVEEWNASLEGLKLAGSLNYDGKSCSIASLPYEGSIAEIIPFVKRYLPHLDLSFLEGTVSFTNKGWEITGEKSKEKWDWKWSFLAKLAELKCNLGSFGQFEQGEVLFSTGSEGGFSLQDAKACYVLHSFSCDVALKDFRWAENKQTEFFLMAKEGPKQVVVLSGNVLPKKEEIAVEIHPTSHILGTQFSVEPIHIKKDGSISLIRGSCGYKWQQVPAYLSFFEKMGFSIAYPFPALRGDARLMAVFDPQGGQCKVHIETEDLVFQEKSQGSFKCDLYHKGDLWKIDSCQIGEYVFSLEAKQKEKQWIFHSLSCESKAGKIQAQGAYHTDSQFFSFPTFSVAWKGLAEQLEAKGSFKGTFSLENGLEGEGRLEQLAGKQNDFFYAIKKGTAFSIASQEIFVEKSQWECLEPLEKKKIAKVEIDQIFYQFLLQKINLSGMNFSCAKEVNQYLQKIIGEKINLSLGKEISARMDVELAPDYKKITGTIKNGFLGLWGLNVDVKTVQFLQEKQAVYLSCQTLCQKEPVCIQWQGEGSLGVLHIKEGNKAQGLCLQMEKKANLPWTVLSADGSFQGVELKAAKNSSKKGLYYDLKLGLDFAKISPFLPVTLRERIKQLGLGSGYRYEGGICIDPNNFELISFQGKFLANEFDLLGKTFASLSSKVQFSKTSCAIQDFLIEDEVGVLSVKVIDAKAHPETGQWMVFAPLVHIKDFSPEAFIKGSKEGAVIKNISLHHLRGLLHDINSFEAKGALNFVKAVKKEFSFWDIPLNLIKDFGLDTGLLTPIVGEADFILSHGRCYFTSLKNMFSEGERSQFDLASPSEDAYLALDGTWHVDLKMKQSVVWKVTEDLVLSIRGTIEKPKYSFKWRKNDS